MAKRENFSEKTKLQAAEKVAFLCSNPTCRCLTVGPSDSGKPHRYGEAAHIYAASSAGPRGTPIMSKSKLVSEENCLWLCNNCHELVDANPNKYTPALLLEWKRSAEEKVFEIISNQDKSKTMIEQLINNCGLSTYFDELFYKGDFEKIVHAMTELNGRKTLVDKDKDELIFAQFRYNAFCARKDLDKSIIALKSCSQNVKERAVNFALTCFDEELCNSIGMFSNDVYKREFASLICKNDNIREVANWISSNRASLDENITNSALLIGCVKSGNSLIDEQRNRVSFRGGWLLDTFDTIADFIYDAMNERLDNAKGLQLLLDKVSIYSWLDKKYICDIFDKNYMFFPKDNTFKRLFKSLIDYGVSSSIIRVNYYLPILVKEIKNDLVEEALKVGIKYDDTRLLSDLLFLLANNQPDKTLAFLEENSCYLYGDLLFFEPYCLAKDKLSQSIDRIDFLTNRYKGEKNAYFYLLRAQSHLLKGEIDNLNDDWETFKKSYFDYDDIYVAIALDIAFKKREEDIVKKICENTMNVSVLFHASELIITNQACISCVTIVLEKLKKLMGVLPDNYYRIMFNLCAIVKKYDEAIQYGTKAYFEKNDVNIAGYVIQFMIDLAKYDENNFIIDVANNSIDPETLNLLGQFYLNGGNLQKGWKYIARSISLINGDIKIQFVVPFVECEYLNERNESGDYTYVIAEDNTSFLLLPSSEKKYFGGQVSNTRVFYTDENTDLCFLKKGDDCFIDKKQIRVKSVYEYFYFFHELAIKKLIMQPSTITLKGSNAEELITNITEEMKEMSNRRTYFLKNSSGKPLPLFFFEKQLGQGLFSAIEVMYFSKIRNSYFVLMDKSSEGSIDTSNGFLFDVEMVYMAFKLGLSDEIVMKDKCKMSGLTKGLLMNEIAKQENIYKGNRQKGTLTFSEDKDRIAYLDRTDDERRKALKELHDLKRFVNSFNIVTPPSLSETKDQDEVLRLFRENRDTVDEEVSACLWNGEVLVTNNLMFHMASNFGNGHTIDISRYLSLSSCTAAEAINIVKNLQKTNIKQYITPDVFNSIIKKIADASDTDNYYELVDLMVELINGNWDLNWSPEQIKMHKYNIYIASICERLNLKKNNKIHAALADLSNELIYEFVQNNQ